MKERQFEEILIRYPELIENGLSLRGRQNYVDGKFVDLLFEDRHGQTLIVELKRGPIKREHIAQLLDYEGHFLSPDDPTVRVMLVGNRVPQNLRKALDHHGFEWKEISIKSLMSYLAEMKDYEYLEFFSSQKTTKQTVKRQSVKKTKTPKGDHYGLSSRTIRPQETIGRNLEETLSHDQGIETRQDGKIYGSLLPNAIDSIIKELATKLVAAVEIDELPTLLKSQLKTKGPDGKELIIEKLDERLPNWRDFTSAKDPEHFVLTNKMPYRVEKHLHRLLAEG